MFQPSRIGNTPLALLKFQGGNAARDALFAHGEANFGLRVLINTYEAQLSVKNLFAPERKSKTKSIKAGRFSDVEFPFETNTFVFPNPKVISFC